MVFSVIFYMMISILNYFVCQTLQYKIIPSLLQTPMNRQQNKSSKHQNSISVQGRLSSFQQTIRKKQLNSIIDAMRDQLLVAQNEDYHILKNINLDECFNEINRIQDISNELKKLDATILNMFAYCVSENSSHFYWMMSDFTLQKMIKMVQWKNIMQYENKPRVYVRIQRIIANYCNYAGKVPSIYFDVIGQLLQNILRQEKFYQQSLQCQFFTHTQTKQIICLIFYGLSEIKFEKLEDFDFDFFIKKSQNLTNGILNEAMKVLHYFQTKGYDSNNKATSILYLCIKIFENFLALKINHSFDQINEQQKSQILKLKIIESNDIQIINQLLEILKYGKDNSKQLQFLVAICFTSYFQNNLHEKPDILLRHDFRIILDCFKQSVIKIKQIHSQIFNYNNKLQIEGQKNVSLFHLHQLVKDQQKLLSTWLRVLVIIFGVNLPNTEETYQQIYSTTNPLTEKQKQIINLQKAYYEIWIDWLENYIIPQFSQILKLNLRSKEIMPKIMNILENICLDQTLCEILLDQPTIQNFIFYNCKSAEVKIDLRRQSLFCLVNMLKASFGESMKKLMLSEAKKHDFPTIFADNIGASSLPQTNQRLLEGLLSLLQLEIYQKKSESNFWRLFCEGGGKRQMQKILAFEGQEWKNTIKLAQIILYQYDLDEV